MQIDGEPSGNGSGTVRETLASLWGSVGKRWGTFGGQLGGPLGEEGGERREGGRWQIDVWPFVGATSEPFGNALRIVRKTVGRPLGGGGALSNQY